MKVHIHVGRAALETNYQKRLQPKRKKGDHDEPVFVLRTDRNPRQLFSVSKVVVHGPTTFIYRPDTPLAINHGQVSTWIEADAHDVWITPPGPPPAIHGQQLRFSEFLAEVLAGKYGQYVETVNDTAPAVGQKAAGAITVS